MRVDKLVQGCLGVVTEVMLELHDAHGIRHLLLRLVLAVIHGLLCVGVVRSAQLADVLAHGQVVPAIQCSKQAPGEKKEQMVSPVPLVVELLVSGGVYPVQHVEAVVAILCVLDEARDGL